MAFCGPVQQEVVNRRDSIKKAQPTFPRFEWLAAQEFLR